MSRAIQGCLGDADLAPFENFREFPCKGISATVGERRYLIGSAPFLAEHGVAHGDDSGNDLATVVHAAAEGRYLGAFAVKNKARQDLAGTVNTLSRDYQLALVSGDSDRERARFAEIFPLGAPMHFGAAPGKKAEIVRAFNNSAPTMMIGDGLNDAAALNVATLGIALSENQANFSPASDAILSASSFSRLPKLLRQARQAKMTTIAAYLISFGYNIFGVSVALKGDLTPLFCAILMPLSSLSVIAFTFLSARVGARGRRIY